MIVLHILLLLLKIIGILLLIILGLLLVILLVPIRYGFDVAYEQGDKPQANVRVTWFTKLLQVKGGYNEEGIYYNAKVAWKTLVTSEEEEETKEESAPKEEAGSQVTEKPAVAETGEDGSDGGEGSSEQETSGSEDISAKEEGSDGSETFAKEDSSDGSETYAKEESSDGSETSAKEAGSGDGTSSAKKKEAKATSNKKSKKGSGKKCSKKKASGKAGAKNTSKDAGSAQAKTSKEVTEEEGKEEQKPGIIDKINEKKEFVQGKIEQVRELYKEYRVGELLPFVKKLLISIIKHVIPRSLTGHAAYGFADPALTGQITGYAAMFYPLYAKSFTLSPNFCEEELDVAVEGKGRIRLGFFVWILIRVLLNRHVWHDIRLILKR